MTHLCIAPIVEGHGETASIRILLERIWCELVGGVYIDVQKPIRQHRQKLTNPKELQRAVYLAVAKLANRADTAVRGTVLILIDADEDCPAVEAPKILSNLADSNANTDIICVLANVEYETWFVAAAESLREFLLLDSEDDVPHDPEQSRSGKSWIKKRFKGTKYSETQDQPRMTHKMDLNKCRLRSPSFDKLCRELENRVSQVGQVPRT